MEDSAPEILSIQTDNSAPEITEDTEKIKTQLVEILAPLKEQLSQFNLIFMNGWGEPKDFGYQGVMHDAFKSLGITNAQFEEIVGGDHPKYEENKNRFLELLRASDKPPVVIAHSLGSQLAFRSLLEDYDGPELPLMIGVASAIFYPHNIRHPLTNNVPIEGARRVADTLNRMRREKGRGKALDFYTKLYSDYKEHLGLPIDKLILLKSQNDNAVPNEEHSKFEEAIGAFPTELVDLQDSIGKHNRVSVNLGDVGHLNYPEASIWVAQALSAGIGVIAQPKAA